MTLNAAIQFDEAGKLYFIDELNGGCIYKFTSAAQLSKVKNGKEDYFRAGGEVRGLGGAGSGVSDVVRSEMGC